MVGHYVRYVPTFYKGCKLNLLVNAAYIEAVTLGRSFCRIEDRFYLKPLEAGLENKYDRIAGIGSLLAPALSGVVINHPKLGMCVIN
jgi:hypothetical protein